jgi:hypothetical protein
MGPDGRQSRRRAQGRSKPRRRFADQRAEAINCAIPYPPRMTAAKLPATTARRKATVTAYSMAKPSKRRAPLPRQEGYRQIKAASSAAAALQCAPFLRRPPPDDAPVVLKASYRSGSAHRTGPVEGQRRSRRATPGEIHSPSRVAKQALAITAELIVRVGVFVPTRARVRFRCVDVHPGPQSARADSSRVFGAWAKAGAARAAPRAAMARSFFMTVSPDLRRCLNQAGARGHCHLKMHRLSATKYEQAHTCAAI